MKKVLAFAGLGIAVAPTVFGQYGPEQLIPMSPSIYLSESRAFDLDGDGDADLLGAALTADQVVWMEQVGPTTFGPVRVISSAQDAPRTIDAADLDGDGDLDVLCGSDGVVREVAWYENLGAGSFGGKRTIATNTGREVRAHDLDGDGDLDVIAMSSMPGGTIWCNDNLGGGVFGPAWTILAAVESPGEFADLDGDGDLDLLASIAANTLGWFPNLGSGSFGGEVVLLTGTTWLVDVCVTDLNGDALPDVVAIWAPNTVTSHVALGSGQFASPLATSLPVLAVGPIREVRDFDLDGDGDLLTSCSQTSGGPFHPPTNYFGAWLVHLGGGAFAASAIAPATVSGPGLLSAADLDLDGDLDVLRLNSNASNALSWFENEFGRSFGPTIPVVSGSGWGGLQGAADLDLDGDVDFVMNGGNALFWIENHGIGSISVRVLNSNAFVRDVEVADVDGDGDDDVFASVVTPSWGIVVCENLGTGSFGPPVFHSTVGSTAFVIHSPRQLAVADLDGDGDLDVISAGGDPALDHGLVWLENLGGTTFAPVALLAAGAQNEPDIEFADLDGDGRLDLIECYWLTWRRNLGGGSLASSTPIGPPAGRAKAADVDGDGDVDIVVNSFLHPSEVSWYPNLGQGTFGTARLVWRATFDGGGDLAVCDVDGNGTLDIVVAGMGEAALAWFSNDGTGAFGSRQVIAATTHAGVVPVDMDGDGDPDLVSASFEGLYWSENRHTLGTTYCAGQPNSAGAPGGLVATGTTVASLDRLHLRAKDLPLATFGYFLSSRTQGLTPNPGGSQGDLCLGGLIGRYSAPGQVGSSGASGQFHLALDLTQMPTPVGFVPVLAGETWNFQAWYRDANPQPTSNFTDAVSVTFL